MENKAEEEEEEEEEEEPLFIKENQKLIINGGTS